jgi:hypothetical protein
MWVKMTVKFLLSIAALVGFNAAYSMDISPSALDQEVQAANKRARPLRDALSFLKSLSPTQQSPLKDLSTKQSPKQSPQLTISDYDEPRLVFSKTGSPDIFNLEKNEIDKLSKGDSVHITTAMFTGTKSPRMLLASIKKAHQRGVIFYVQLGNHACNKEVALELMQIGAQVAYVTDNHENSMVISDDSGIAKQGIIQTARFTEKGFVRNHESCLLDPRIASQLLAAKSLLPTIPSMPSGSPSKNTIWPLSVGVKNQITSSPSAVTLFNSQETDLNSIWEGANKRARSATIKDSTMNLSNKKLLKSYQSVPSEGRGDAIIIVDAESVNSKTYPMFKEAVDRDGVKLFVYQGSNSTQHSKLYIREQPRENGLSPQKTVIVSTANGTDQGARESNKTVYYPHEKKLYEQADKNFSDLLNHPATIPFAQFPKPGDKKRKATDVLISPHATPEQVWVMNDVQDGGNRGNLAPRKLFC